MRILQIHNYHKSGAGGAEVVFESLVDLLCENDHDVRTVTRYNANIESIVDKGRAALSGLYSREAKAEVASVLEAFRPDIMHVHNVYPLLSPSILEAGKEAGVPIVMSVQDFKMICPTAQFFRDGQVCELCTGGKEHWCVLTNCRGNLAESVAYAARTASNRRAGRFVDNVTLFAPPTRFVARRLANDRFPKGRIRVVPNMAMMPEELGSSSQLGEYVAYVGRISPEKGVELLVEAAARSGVPVRIAGNPESMPRLVSNSPENVEFVGWLTRDALTDFYSGARFAVVPSLCFETFGISAAEAMGHGLPVIAAAHGGLVEVVADDETGVHFDPGNVTQLASAMDTLWNEESQVLRMGRRARDRASQHYSKEANYSEWMEAYGAANKLFREGC